LRSPGTTDAWVKIERAEQHIRDLDAEVAAFLDTRPYAAVAKMHRNGGKTFRAVVREQPPAHLGLIAGDAIHNLRSSLDILIWDLVRANRLQPSRSDMFPFARNAEEYLSKRGRGKIKSIPQAAVDVLDAIQPYRGGNDVLHEVHRLDIEDKHHVLLPMAAAAEYLRFSVTANGGKPVLFPMGDGAPIISPVKDGTKLGWTEISIPHPKLEMDMDVEFAFYVTLSEAKVCAGKPIGELLTELANVVERTVTQLEVFL